MKYPPLSAVLFFFCIWQHHWRPLQSTFQAQGVTVVWCKSAKRIVTQEGCKLWLKTIFSFGKALFPLVTRNGQGEPLISSTVPLTKPVLPHCSEESGKTWKQVDFCNIHPKTYTVTYIPKSWKGGCILKYTLFRPLLWWHIVSFTANKDISLNSCIWLLMKILAQCSLKVKDSVGVDCICLSILVKIPVSSPGGC